MSPDWLQGEHEEWAALYAAGALTPDENRSFERHLDAGCDLCRLLLREFEGVSIELADAVAAPPPASLRSTILNRIRAEAVLEKNQHQNGILLQRAGVLVSRTEEMPWVPVPLPGMRIKKLFVDSARNYSTSLVHLDAGSVYPAHQHNDVEEFYLLEGDLSGEGIQMRAGDYCRSEPGSIHSAAKTETGALLLVWSSNLDRVL